VKKLNDEQRKKLNDEQHVLGRIAHHLVFTVEEVLLII
jgi:hypothetical protein